MAGYYCLARTFPLTLSVAICPGPRVSLVPKSLYSGLMAAMAVEPLAVGRWRSQVGYSVFGSALQSMRTAGLSTSYSKRQLSSTSIEYCLRLLDFIVFVYIWLHPRSVEFLVILWPPWIICLSGVQRLVGFDCLCDGSCLH